MICQIENVADRRMKLKENEKLESYLNVRNEKKKDKPSLLTHWGQQ